MRKKIVRREYCAVRATFTAHRFAFVSSLLVPYPLISRHVAFPMYAETETTETPFITGADIKRYRANAVLALK